MSFSINSTIISMVIDKIMVQINIRCINQGNSFFTRKYTSTPSRAIIITFIIQLGLLTRGAASCNNFYAYYNLSKLSFIFYTFTNILLCTTPMD